MWNSKFVNGSIELGGCNGCKVTIYSNTDDDKKYIYNGGYDVIDAYWQGGRVIVVLDDSYGSKIAYTDECNCMSI